MDKVLILGAAGFTGKHFVRFLAEDELLQQYEFVLAGRTDNFSPALPFIKLDPADRDGIDRLVRSTRPDYIINLIGSHTENDFDRLLRINAGIAKDLCDSILRHSLPLKKLLLIGSAAEYGRTTSLPITEDCVARPASPYGLTKLIQSQYALYYAGNFGLPVSVARTFNIIGRGIPRTLSIGNFVHQINAAKDGETVHTGNLDTRRDFLDVSDVIDAYWKILLLGTSGEVYNVCRGSSFLQRDLLDYLISGSGKKLHKNVRPEYVKADDIIDSYGDNSKLRQATGWIYKVDILDSLRSLLDVK